MMAMNKIQPPAKTPKEYYVKFLMVRAEDRETYNKARQLGYIEPIHTPIMTPTLLVTLLDRRNRREVRSGERRVILLNLLLSRPVGLAALKVTLDLIVLRIHIRIETNRMCHSYRVL
jgi:hypothetical protein